MKTIQVVLALIVGIVFFCCWWAYIIVNMNSSVTIPPPPPPPRPPAAASSYSEAETVESNQHIDANQQLNAANENRTLPRHNSTNHLPSASLVRIQPSMQHQYSNQFVINKQHEPPLRAAFHSSQLPSHQSREHQAAWELQQQQHQQPSQFASVKEHKNNFPLDYSSVRALKNPDNFGLHQQQQQRYQHQQNRWLPAAATTQSQANYASTQGAPFNQPAEASLQHLTWPPQQQTYGSPSAHLTLPFLPTSSINANTNSNAQTPAKSINRPFYAKEHVEEDPNPDVGVGVEEHQDDNNDNAKVEADQQQQDANGDDDGDHHQSASDLINETNSNSNDDSDAQPEAGDTAASAADSASAGDSDGDSDEGTHPVEENNNYNEDDNEPNREYEEQVGRRSYSEDLSDSNERDKYGDIVSVKRKHLINGKPVVVESTPNKRDKIKQQQLKQLKRQRESLPNPLKLERADAEQLGSPAGTFQKRMAAETDFEKVVKEIDRHKEEEKEQENRKKEALKRKKLLNVRRNGNNLTNHHVEKAAIIKPYELDSVDGPLQSAEEEKPMASSTTPKLILSSTKLLPSLMPAVAGKQAINSTTVRKEAGANNIQSTKKKLTNDNNNNNNNNNVNLRPLSNSSSTAGMTIGGKRTLYNNENINHKRAGKRKINSKEISNKKVKDDKEEEKERARLNADVDQGEEEVEEIGENSKDLEPKRKKDLHSHRLKESLEAQQWDDDSNGIEEPEEEQKEPTRGSSYNKNNSNNDGDSAADASFQDQVAESAQPTRQLAQLQQEENSERQSPEAEEAPQRHKNRNIEGDEQQQQAEEEENEEIEFKDLDFMVDSEKFPFMEPDIEVEVGETTTTNKATAAPDDTANRGHSTVGTYARAPSSSSYPSNAANNNNKTIENRLERRKRSDNMFKFDDDDNEYVAADGYNYGDGAAVNGSSDHNVVRLFNSTNNYDKGNVYPLVAANSSNISTNNSEFLSLNDYYKQQQQLNSNNISNSLMNDLARNQANENGNNKTNNDGLDLFLVPRKTISTSSDSREDKYQEQIRALAHNNGINSSISNKSFPIINVGGTSNINTSNLTNEQLSMDNDNNLRKRMDGQEDLAIEVVANPPGIANANASFLINTVPENNSPLVNGFYQPTNVGAYYQTTQQAAVPAAAQTPEPFPKVEQADPPPPVDQQPQYQGTYDQSDNPPRASGSKSAKKKLKYHKSKKSKLYEGKHKAAKAYKTKKKSKYKKGAMKKKKVYDKKKFLNDYKDFKGSTRGKKGKKGHGYKGAKKGALYFRDKGYKKKGFKKNYQKVETGDHKTYFDEFRDKDHSKKWKDYNDKHHYSQRKKWAGNDKKKYKNYALKEYMDKKHGHGHWNEKAKSKYSKAYKLKKEMEKKSKKSSHKKKKKKKKH